MNFSSMEYFTVLARERSFTRAAEQLHITQQSLSAHIAGMEQELGCPLVVRRIPLELTYAGSVLLRYATDFQQSYIAMQREFSDISGNQKGLLRLGVAPTRGRVLLPDVISRFQLSYPNITVELTEDSNGALHRMLRDGALDIAIADFPDAMPGIVLQDFYQENVVLIIGETLFQSVYGPFSQDVAHRFMAGDCTQLRSCPPVMGTLDDIDGHIGYDLLGKAGIHAPVIRSVSHNVGMLLTLCLQGIGACFCPENLARAMLSEEDWRKLLRFPLGNVATYTIRFGYRRQSYQWSVLSAFMTIAGETLGGKN